MNTLLRSSDFDAWLSHLADQKAKARILARLTSATFGNFGDCEPVGSTVYVLLAGGVKASQTKDIASEKNGSRAQRAKQ